MNRECDSRSQTPKPSHLIFLSLEQLLQNIQIQWYRKLWYILSCNSMINNEIQCNTMLYSVIQWNVIQRNAIQFNKMHYNIKQNHSITCNNNTILRHLQSINPIYRMVSSISYLIFTTTRSWRPSCNAMIYNEIQCNTMQYSVIQ